MPKFIDLTGMKFDRLTVISRADNHITPSGKPIVMWQCECECGNIVKVAGGHLRNRLTKSCGCLLRECAREKGKQKKQYNRYDLSGSFGIGYTHNNNKPFYFDLEDYEKIKDYCWYESTDGYVVTHDCGDDRVRLQRFIMDPLKNSMIGYMNRNPFDNRKSNLRIVTRAQSMWGSKKRKDNTSGFTGVYFIKRSKKWKAEIKVNGKLIRLGVYFNKNDAIEARKEAEEKYFGEYSYDNRMKGDETNE